MLFRDWMQMWLDVGQSAAADLMTNFPADDLKIDEWVFKITRSKLWKELRSQPRYDDQAWDAFRPTLIGTIWYPDFK